MPAPVAPAERSRFLDVLRGIAMLGILPANIAFFALPIVLAAEAGESIADQAAYYANRLFVEYKFVSLFSLLFGAGIMVLAGRVRRGRLVRRLVVLWGIGILHATLLWFGDIVATYALLGLLVMWAARWKPATLARVGIALVLVPAVAMLLLAGVAPEIAEWFQRAGEAAPERGPVAPATSSWLEFLEGAATLDPDFETQVYREGSYLRITVLRSLHWFFLALFWIPYFGWRIVGLFLLGMAWAKAGWLLRPDADAQPFRRLVAYGILAGLPLEIAACVLDARGSDLWAEWAHYTGSLGIAAAYAGLVALAIRRRPRARWAAPLEAVGRTAFSNYLLQSVLCTLVFYSYGLGLYGSIGRAALLGVVAAVWAIELALSPLWLRAFRFGPVEWVWRVLTYGRQPLGQSSVTRAK